MNDGMVWKWVRTFKDGRQNVHDGKWSGDRHLVQKVDEKIKENKRLFLRYSKSFQKCSLCNFDRTLKLQAADFYDDGIQKRLVRYNRCLIKAITYVKK